MIKIIYNNIKFYYWVIFEIEIVLQWGYFLFGEMLQDVVCCVIIVVVNCLDCFDLQLKFEVFVVNGWMLFFFLVWANMGIDCGLLISCFGFYVEDSMDGIIKILFECIMMIKFGGGILVYFGYLCEWGVGICNNGKFFGLVFFLKMFDVMIDIVSQGNVCCGVFVVYLDIEYLDVNEFFKIKDIGNVIQNIFFGVIVIN